MAILFVFILWLVSRFECFYVFLRKSLFLFPLFISVSRVTTCLFSWCSTMMSTRTRSWRFGTKVTTSSDTSIKTTMLRSWTLCVCLTILFLVEFLETRLRTWWWTYIFWLYRPYWFRFYALLAAASITTSH